MAKTEPTEREIAYQVLRRILTDGRLLQEAMSDVSQSERFTELFAKQDTITHQDVRYAFELSLTRNRITPLLHRLVSEGRLISIGRGAQTRYRAAEGHFGR